MKKSFFLIGLFISFYAMGQPFPLDTLIISERKYDYISVSVNDSIYLLRINNSRRRERNNAYVFKKHGVDTLNIPALNIPIHFEEYLFFKYIYKDKTIPVWSESKGLEYLSYEQPIFSDLGGEYIVLVSGSSKSDYRIDYFNPITREKKLLIKLQDLQLPDLPRIPWDGEWAFMRPFIIDDERSIIQITYMFEESGIDYFYFKRGKDIEIINELFEGVSSISENAIISNNRKMIAFQKAIYTEKEVRRHILLTSNLEYIGDILYRNRPTGLNMQNGKFSGYFLSSRLDNEHSAVFYYELNPTLELAMYKAYHDGILTNQDIKGLNKKDLGILRNLLFAKHNYQFDSQFYQAYYSTFEFYGGVTKRRSRTKDINHLLTEADKANITLIRAAEERANGIED